MLRGIVGNAALELRTHLREVRCDGAVFLGVEVAGKPPGFVVAGERELRELIFDDERLQVFLFGELVAEAEAVVEEAEANDHDAVGCRLLQRNGEFVVVIADLALLAPNRLPGFVEGAGVLLDDGEAGGERLGVEKFEAHQARLEDDFAFVGQGVLGLTLLA